VRLRTIPGLILGSLVLLSVASPLPAQQSSTPAGSPVQQPNPPVTTLTAVARSVVLDIAVVDAKGHPVRGLKQSDFVLLEDGVPQTLTSFEEHTSNPAVAPVSQPKLPPNTFTNFIPPPNSVASTVLLLDVLDTSIQAQMYLHEQVVEYMKHVPPGTSMAVFVLDERMHLLQGFTTDPQTLLEAVKSKRDNPHFSVYDGGNAVYQRLRHDILTEGLQELGRYLAGFPGRKSLIWFTGTVPRELYGSGIGNPFRESSSFADNTGVADYAVDDLAATTDVLTLSRVAVFPIDARGLIAPSGGREPHIGNALEYNRETLEQVAQATGGKAFYNTNGLKDAISEVVDTSANFYTVSYTPYNKDWHGQTRHIKVEFISPGYTLEYRRSYRARGREKQELRHLASVEKKKNSGNFTPLAETQAPNPSGVLLSHGPKESLQASMTLGAIPPTELIFAASLKPAPAIQKIEKKAPLPPENYLRPAWAGKPFRDFDILYATDARKLALNQTPDGVRHGQVSYVAVLYSDQGDVVNSIITTLSLDLTPPTYRHLAQTGLPVTQRIAVPVKGNYFLRLGIRDESGDRVGALEIPIDAVKLGVAGAGQALTP